MDVSIEPMTEADLDEVVAIEEASFVRPWTRRSFQEELTRNSLATYLVAKREGRVVGYGGIWVILDEAHLTTLAVAPDCRQRGIGSRLLTALMEKAVQAGSRCISLEVRPSNLAARKLYGKYCFRVEGVRKKYHDDEDGLIMFRELNSKGESCLGPEKGANPGSGDLL